MRENYEFAIFHEMADDSFRYSNWQFHSCRASIQFGISLDWHRRVSSVLTYYCARVPLTETVQWKSDFLPRIQTTYKCSYFDPTQIVHTSLVNSYEQGTHCFTGAVYLFWENRSWPEAHNGCRITDLTARPLTSPWSCSQVTPCRFLLVRELFAIQPVLIRLTSICTGNRAYSKTCKLAC